MLKLKAELELEISTSKKERKELVDYMKEAKLNRAFNIGTTAITVAGISDSQMIYALSIMKSRLNGVKSLPTGVRQDLIEECRKELRDFIECIGIHSEISRLDKLNYENIELMYDLKALLTEEEKRELFLIKAKERKQYDYPIDTRP